MSGAAKPIVLITGADGNIGRSLAAALADRYRVVGLDRASNNDDRSEAGFPLIEADLTDDRSVAAAMEVFRRIRLSDADRVDFH